MLLCLMLWTQIAEGSVAYVSLHFLCLLLYLWSFGAPSKCCLCCCVSEDAAAVYIRMHTHAQPTTAGLSSDQAETRARQHTRRWIAAHAEAIQANDFVPWDAASGTFTVAASKQAALLMAERELDYVYRTFMIIALLDHWPPHAGVGIGVSDMSSQRVVG